jgi:hypothetical protein
VPPLPAALPPAPAPLSLSQLALESEWVRHVPEAQPQNVQSPVWHRWSVPHVSLMPQSLLCVHSGDGMHWLPSFAQSYPPDAV